MSFEKLENQLLDLLDKAEAGELDTLETYANLKKLSGIVSDAVKQLEEKALQEASKHDGNFIRGSFSFESRGGRKIWDFKPVKKWAELNNQIKQLEGSLKMAFEARQNDFSMVDEETGEIQELPNISFSKPSLIVREVKK